MSTSEGADPKAHGQAAAPARPRPSAADPSAPAAAKAAQAGSEPSFEESVRRLAKIVEQLEAGDLPLEKSLELFEEGVVLARTAQERLDRAERRVEELLGIDAHGKPVTRDFDG